MSQRDDFDRVMTSLHDAMLDDAHWPATSVLIDDACDINGSNLLVGRNRATTQVFFGQRHEQRQHWYFANCFFQDEAVPRIVELPDSRLIPVSELYTEEEKKTSLAYNVAFRNLRQNGLTVRLDGPEGANVVWSLGDSTQRDGWGSDQVAMIERLLPHIRHFAHIRLALAGAEALGTSLLDLLDVAKVGVVYLDRRGRIVEANDGARAILRQRDGLLEEGGMLGASLAADNALLDRLLAGVLPVSGDQGVSGSITLRRTPGRPRLTLHVSPVGPRHKTFGVRGVAALALVVDPENGLEIDPHRMAALLGLTPVEARVATLLAEGLGIPDIAAATGRRESTIRWNLKRIYLKQGISRQAELVRLVLTTAGFKGSSPSAQP